MTETFGFLIFVKIFVGFDSNSPSLLLRIYPDTSIKNSNDFDNFPSNGAKFDTVECNTMSDSKFTLPMFLDIEE